MKDLGVQVKNGLALDADKGLTIRALQNDGYDCVFLGIGFLNSSSKFNFK